MDYQSTIERKLIPQGTSGDEVIYACPFCEPGNIGHHLYVNYKKDKWHCLRCKHGGSSLNGLLTKLNISFDIDYDSLYNEYEESLDTILSDLNPKKKSVQLSPVDYSTDLIFLNQYYNYHIQPLSPAAYDYLLQRGFSPEIISRMHLSEGINRFGESFKYRDKECFCRNYSGRIMIPSMRQDGTITFYLGRDYTGLKSNKYSNAPKDLSVASEDVWSLDLIEGDTCIICEGAFTAMSVDSVLNKHIACATYGKSIAQRSSSDILVTSQGEKLLSKHFSNYIIFYDRDAQVDAYETAEYLYDRGAHVRIVRFPVELHPDKPKLDANDLIHEPDTIRQLIVNSEEFTLIGSIL